MSMIFFGTEKEFLCLTNGRKKHVRIERRPGRISELIFRQIFGIMLSLFHRRMLYELWAEAADAAKGIGYQPE